MKKLAILSYCILMFLIISCGKPVENKKSVLKVGMELKWPPFEMVDGNGNATGISVDLAKELGKELGMEVKIVDTAFGSLIPALETGKIDVAIASMSITEERAKKIDFSKPYFYFKLVTLVNKKSNIKSKDELFKRETVRFVGPKAFVSLRIPAEKANKPILREFDDKSTAVLEVVQDKADAFIIDAIAAAEFNKKYPLQTDIIWDAVQLSPIGMGVKKGNKELLDKLNRFIENAEKNGVYKRLGEKYDKTIENSLPGKTLKFYTDLDE